MIHLTQNAAAQIKAMLVEQKKPLESGLRIGVEGGGCSGMQYMLSFDSKKEGDQVFHEHDANIFVDSASLAFLDESTVDYADGLTAAGFRIHNPKAKQTCGCGTSFEA
jgi:iron-sulfur cluster assembly protein